MPNVLTPMVRKTCVWSRDSGRSEKVPLDEQIVALLDLIEPSAAELRALRDEGCTIECFTMFASTSGQGGITLDVTVLRRMAALGVDLSLDLYPPEERS